MLVAEKVGTVPTRGLELVSRKVMVTVEVALPLAVTGPVPVMLEFAASAVPAWKVTAPPVKVIGEVTCRVLASALVEESVQVETPDELVAAQVP